MHKSPGLIIVIIILLFASLHLMCTDENIIVSAGISHAPIFIDSNDEFTAENGVSSGTGAISDPFVIAGFDINASGTHGIQIRNTDVHFIIRDVTIHSGGKTFTGITFHNVRFGEVKYSRIENNYHGIQFEDSTEMVIKNNTIIRNTDGMILKSSNNNTIDINNISANSNSGISVESSWSNIVTGNLLCVNFQNGIRIQSDSEYNKIARNEIIENRESGIILDSSSKNTIEDNYVSSNYQYGVYVRSSSSNNEFSRNNITTNGWEGVLIDTSSDNVLKKNNILSNNWNGVRLKSGTNNRLDGNNISINSRNGINFNHGSINNILEENIISSNTQSGIRLMESGNNMIKSNIIIENIEQGIYIDLNSNDNRVENNAISYNEHGVYIYTSSNNWIVHNNFMNNTYHAFAVEGTNVWNDSYPSGGNYWSKFGSEDNYQGANQDEGGADGIYDNYYFINSDNKDNYPLANPYGEKVISAPRNLTATSGSYFVLLTWDLPLLLTDFSIAHYIIYRSNLPGRENVLTEIGAILFYNDTRVDNGVTYYYSVRAKSTVAEGLISDEITARPGNTPSAPRISKIDTGESFINLSWDPPVVLGGSDVSNYKLLKCSMDDGKEIIIELGNNTFYNDTDVIAGVIYNYKLTAENEFGVSPFSNEIIISPLVVANQLPVASISTDSQAGSPPLTVKFLGLGVDPDGTIASYEWDFDDGTTSTEQNPVHTFTALGTYNVALTVIDDKGAEGMDEILISISESDDIIDSDETPTNAKDDLWDTYGTWVVIGSGTTIIVLILLIANLLLAQSKLSAGGNDKKRKKREIRTVRKQLKLKVKTDEIEEFASAQIDSAPDHTMTEQHQQETTEVEKDELIEKPVDNEYLDTLDQQLILGEITEEKYKKQKLEYETTGRNDE